MVYKVPVEDNEGNPFHALHYRGFHIIFSEPLTPDEETQFKKYLDYVRESRKERNSKCPA